MKRSSLNKHVAFSNGRCFIANCLIIFLTIGLANVIPLKAQQLDEQSLHLLDKKRYQVEEDIQNINNLLKTVEGKQKSGIQTLTLIKKKIDSRKQVLSTIDKQIITLQNQLSNKQEAIEILQADLVELRRSYTELLTQYYSYRNKTNWLMYIMASESVSQGYKRMKYLREILMLLQAQATKITDMTNQLNVEINNMSLKQKLLDDNLDDKKKEVGNLLSEEQESRNVLSSLKKQESELRAQLNERKKEYDRLDSEMKVFMREELNKNATIGISDEMLMAAKDFEQVKGMLPWPAMGIIVANFGSDNVHPVYKSLKMPNNNGIDIQTQTNAEVYSIFTGTVSKIFPMQGMGNCILIQHGSYYTLYARLATCDVKVGDQVKARQRIGTVLTIPEGSILHFQLWKRTEVQNPEKWLIKY